MESSKKFFIIAMVGLIPLVLIFIFFIYRIKAMRENSQPFLKSGAEKSNSLEWIQSPKSALQKLAEHPFLWQFLEQISKVPIKGENFELLREQNRIYKYIEKFQSQHPEFEEIILKNPETGDVYLSVPAGAAAENFPGTRLVVTVPVSNPEATTPVLLLGFINVNLPGVSKKIRNKNVLAGSKKKAALFFVWFFLFISLLFPIIMFLVYRQMKKRLAPYLYTSSYRHRGRMTNNCDNSPGRE